MDSSEFLRLLMAGLPEDVRGNCTASIINQNGDTTTGVVVDINPIVGRRCPVCVRAFHAGDCTPREEDVLRKSRLANMYLDMVRRSPHPDTGRDMKKIMEGLVRVIMLTSV